MIYLFSVFLLSLSWATNVSLLQEIKDIECAVKDGDSTVQKLWIDKKDYLLTITRGGNQTKESYEQERFLERGILAKNSGDANKFIFFQILPNGQTWLHQGVRLQFKEKDCDDTGASKKCKSPELGEFSWTPEKLALKSTSLKISTAISQYGILPSHATFSLAYESNKSKIGYPALFLIDYGASLDLIAGTSSQMSCSYMQ